MLPTLTRAQRGRSCGLTLCSLPHWRYASSTKRQLRVSGKIIVFGDRSRGIVFGERSQGTLGKSLKVSEVEFPHVRAGDNNLHLLREGLYGAGTPFQLQALHLEF